jgi:hypothetical protein
MPFSAGKLFKNLAPDKESRVFHPSTHTFLACFASNPCTKEGKETYVKMGTTALTLRARGTVAPSTPMALYCPKQPPSSERGDFEKGLCTTKEHGRNLCFQDQSKCPHSARSQAGAQLLKEGVVRRSGPAGAYFSRSLETPDLQHHGIVKIRWLVVVLIFWPIASWRGGLPDLAGHASLTKN